MIPGVCQRASNLCARGERDIIIEAGSAFTDEGGYWPEDRPARSSLLSWMDTKGLRTTCGMSRAGEVRDKVKDCKIYEDLGWQRWGRPWAHPPAPWQA